LYVRKTAFTVFILIALASTLFSGCLQRVIPAGGKAGQSGQLLITVTGDRSDEFINGTAYIDGQPAAIEDGIGQFASLPYGTYVLRIRAEGYQDWEQEINLSSSSLTIEVTLTRLPDGEDPPVDQTGTISGQVADRDSQILIWSAVIRLDGERIRNNEGRYQLSRVSYGRHTITVTMNHYRAYSYIFELDKPELNIDVFLESIWDAWQRRLLAMLVMAEAEGEPLTGKVAVAASVLNRVDSPLYPNTISDVIFQVSNGYYQYSPVRDGRIWNEPNQDSVLAANLALAGWDPSQSATGFYNPAKTSNQWVCSRPVTVRIGNHVFFR